MANTIYHCSLSVRGALKHSTRRERASTFVATNGQKLTADEAKDVLMDHLAKGHECIPMASDCVDFDYTGGGCPGHAEDQL